jgi:DNA-binding NarL/FixJ family response regulator
MGQDIAVPLTRLADQACKNEAGSKIHVGIIAAHLLAAHHLMQLVRAEASMLPVILTEGTNNSVVFPDGSQVVILVDLWGLTRPSSEYLDSLSLRIPNCVFLALDRPRSGNDVAGLLRAGFMGFVTHHEVPYLLAPAINMVAKGMLWSSPEAMGIYVNLTSRVAGRRGAGEMLTFREQQVLELLRRRYSNREVGDVLGIAESTVKFHVSNILAKLNLTNRHQLTESVLRHAPRFVVSNERPKISREKHNQYRCG